MCSVVHLSIFIAVPVDCLWEEFHSALVQSYAISRENWRLPLLKANESKTLACIDTEQWTCVQAAKNTNGLPNNQLKIGELLEKGLGPQ